MALVYEDEVYRLNNFPYSFIRTGKKQSGISQGGGPNKTAAQGSAQIIKIRVVCNVCIQDEN